jgi:hypothetical protein
VGLIITTAIIGLITSLLFLAFGVSNLEDERRPFTEIPGLPNGYLYSNLRGRIGGAPWHRPLNDSVWRTADAAGHMTPHDPVLGLYLNSKAWALPWWVIKNHHVANLILDDQPILITFCEICSSASAFNPVLQGRRHTFRIVGIYNGTILISDFETESFWSPFTGEALHGPLKGSRLERWPLYQCRWMEWLTLHPASLVLGGPQETREGHSKTVQPGAPGIGDYFRKSLLRPLDQRLPHNELVLGVELNGQARVYRLSTLDKIGSIVNDTLGQQDIVILHQPGTMLAVAFSRQIGDEVLVFDREKDGRIVDQKYRGHWTYAGAASDGALAGQKLSYVPSGVEEWYIWAAYHPQTDIFDAGSTLDGDGQK